MTGGRGWILLGVLVLLAAGLASLGAAKPAQAPDHSSTSDAKAGTSAARALAGSLGEGGDAVAGSFDLTGNALVFVFTPTSPFSSGEAAQLHNWVSSGGLLVYAAESGDAELDAAFGVRRAAGQTGAAGQAGEPPLAGVDEVIGGRVLYPLIPSPSQVTILSTGRDTTAYIESIGAGRAIVLADPMVLCNVSLLAPGNARLLTDILGMVPLGGRVAFDEYHHGFTLSDITPQAWLLTPWGAGLAWLVVALFVGLLLRNRAFGPRLPLDPVTRRHSREWAAAVGALLRRSGGAQVTSSLLVAATERTVAGRLGLAVQPRERLVTGLATRAPDLARELQSIEADIAIRSASDDSLLKAARRLHHIAYPITDKE